MCNVHKTQNLCKPKTEQTASIDMIFANICRRICRQSRHLWAHVCVCVVQSIEHLNIVLHVWCYPMHGGIARSFARSIANLVHAHRHTYGDFTCVYATLLPSIQLHLQRNNHFFPTLSLAHGQCNYSTQNNQKQKFSPLKKSRRKIIFPTKLVSCTLHIKDAIVLFFSTAAHSEQCPICMIAGKIDFVENKFFIVLMMRKDEWMGLAAQFAIFVFTLFEWVHLCDTQIRRITYENNLSAWCIRFIWNRLKNKLCKNDCGAIWLWWMWQW